MSTYLAPNYAPKLPEIGDYQPVVPLDLMSKVGMWKQAKYESNHQDVQDQLDKLGQLPIVKESDRQVIASKMGDMVSKLNEYSGQDLGDTRVYNQLLGLTSGFYNDNDVYERVADNQRASSAMKNYQKMIDDDPDTYGANNAKLFLGAYNHWLETPDKKFNGAYTPYYDYKKEENEIIDRVRKDPNVYIKTLSNGHKTPYATEELKVVLPQTIHKALMSGLSGKALRQYQIDWEGTKDNHTVQSTVGELNSQIDQLNTVRSSTESSMKTIKTSKLKEEAQARLDNIDKAIESIKQTKNDVMVTGDPSHYYTFDNYLSQRFKGLSEAYAFQQETNLKYDPYALEMYKHGLDKDLEAFKAKLKKQSEDPTYSTPLENTLWNVGMNGQAHATADELTHIVGGSSKVGDDNSFTFSTHNKQILYDLQPTLKKMGLDIPAKKAAGVSKIMSDYKVWTQTPSGKEETQGEGSFAENENAMGDTYTTGSVRTRTFNEYVKFLGTTQQGQQLIANYKKTYDVDVNSTEDMTIGSRIAADSKMVDNYEKLTKALQAKGLVGSLSVVPGDGDNIIRGADKKLYANVLVQFPKDVFLNALGEGGVFSNTGFNQFESDGVIRNTHVKSKDGKDMYQMSMWVPADGDLQLAHDNYVKTNTSKKDGIDAMGEHRVHFNHTMEKLGYMQPFIEDPTTSVGYVKTHVTGLTGADIDQSFKDGVNDILDKAATKLKSSMSAEERAALITDIIRVGQAKTKDEILKILSQ